MSFFSDGEILTADKLNSLLTRFDPAPAASWNAGNYMRAHRAGWAVILTGSVAPSWAANLTGGLTCVNLPLQALETAEAVVGTSGGKLVKISVAAGTSYLTVSPYLTYNSLAVNEAVYLSGFTYCFQGI
jgi:hypothetical protein